MAFSGVEEDDQWAGVVVADPGVDAVALLGGDVEDDGGGGAGGPGGGTVGWVEVGDLDAAVGGCLEVRPGAESGDDNESSTSLPWVPGDMLRA